MNLFSWIKKSNKKESLGDVGERLAVQYLKKNGYKILETNYQNSRGYKIGEIDIVAQKGKELVFVEVKTRKFGNDQNVLPEENITTQKLSKLEKIAALYLRQKNFSHIPYRFDAITVQIKEHSEDHKIRHLENIFI